MQTFYYMLKCAILHSLTNNLLAYNTVYMYTHTHTAGQACGGPGQRGALVGCSAQGGSTFGARGDQECVYCCRGP